MTSYFKQFALRANVKTAKLSITFKTLLLICVSTFMLFGCGGGASSGGTSNNSAPQSANSPVMPAMPTTPSTPATTPVTTPVTTPTAPATPDTPSSVTNTPVTPSTPLTQDDRELQRYAARFLNQATFGATQQSIDEFIALNNLDAWIDEQQRRPATSHYAMLENTLPTTPELEIWRNHRMDTWFNAVVYGEDQLRQKVAYALSQIFVISDKSAFQDDHLAIAHYYDMLADHAFGNYRQLLEDVTLSPLMGMYLSMRGNEKPNPFRNIRPDENYAREVMQLFSIGLVELNLDGTARLDSQGQTIATYDQTIIEGYAHVFTGWNFNGTQAQNWSRYHYNYDSINPMTPVEQYHDKGQKQLLNGVVVPVNQFAEDDLAMALDSIFMHPNVGPFMAKRLIQHLVTSNPTPQFIARVASVFNDNGAGVRGDLGAVVRAILTDEEARAPAQQQLAYFGKVKEPILRAVQFIRAFEAFTPDGTIEFGYPDWMFNQAPVSAPSVFNFYLPTHMPQGQLSQLGLVSPELSLLTDNFIVRNTNFMAWTGLWGHHEDIDENGQYSNPDELIINYATQIALLDDTEALLDNLDLLLLAGAMPAPMRDVLREYIDEQPWLASEEKVAELAFLIGASPQFAVQR